MANSAPKRMRCRLRFMTLLQYDATVVVAPAKAGAQVHVSMRYRQTWIPTFVGMTTQSTFAPESLTILAYLGISLLISAENSSGVLAAGSAPCCAKNAFISSVPRMRVTSAFHLATISFGVPAGAMNPHQV